MVDEKLTDAFYNLEKPSAYSSRYNLALETGIPLNKVDEWAQSDAILPLFARKNSKFPRNPFYVNSILDILSADLIDFRNLSEFNSNYAYVLVIVDSFSRYIWSFPLKRKTPEEVIKCFRFLFKTHKAKIAVFFDKGREFLNSKMRSFLKENNIQMWLAQNEIKTKAEGSIKLIKMRLWKYFIHKNTRRWKEIMPEICSGINNSLNTSLKYTPAQVLNDPLIAKQAYINLFSDKVGRLMEKHKLEVCQKVRIDVLKGKLEKGITPTRSDEIYTVSKQIKAPIALYELKGTQPDKKGEFDIDGRFYQAELTKIS